MHHGGEAGGRECGARKGKHADSRCRGEPRDGGVEVASSEPPAEEGGGEGMTTGGRPRAERSCMAFLKSPEKTRNVARRRGGGGKGEGVATWFPSARLHTHTRARAHMRTSCRGERGYSLFRGNKCVLARARVYDGGIRAFERDPLARGARREQS